jgi:hypothetical protein
VSVNGVECCLVIALEENLEHDILHAVLEIEEAMLQAN